MVKLKNAFVKDLKLHHLYQKQLNAVMKVKHVNVLVEFIWEENMEMERKKVFQLKISRKLVKIRKIGKIKKLLRKKKKKKKRQKMLKINKKQLTI